MSIENDKIVTLGGLAEYNKSIPKTAKAAMLMAMAEEDSLEKDPAVYEHVLGYQWLKMQEGTPIQLTVPAGTKHIVVKVEAALYREISPTSILHTYDFAGETRNETYSNPAAFLQATELYEAGTMATAPCAYIATSGSLNLDQYQNTGRLTLINEPAWLTYNSSTGKLVYDEVLRDSYEVAGSADLSTQFETDLVSDDGSCPVIGMVYSGLFPGQEAAAGHFVNKYDGRVKSDNHNTAKNSGIINVTDGTSYYLYSFNMPEGFDYSDGSTPLYISVAYFDHFGVARMYSNEDMISARGAYDAKVAAAT